MHRTGTSALTRVMSLRGLDLPRHLMPGQPGNNDPGFWEPAPVAEAHDRFLEAIGSAWDDVSPIPASVFSSPPADRFAGELEQLLRSEYGESTLFVVKDPRICRLIPVWLSALERYGARPSFVITTRNPLEVAASLRARDGFSATKSGLLWLRHLLDAEHDSRGYPRVFVSYENLLRNWAGTTDRIARELHLFWPRADHTANLQIEDFLSSQLRHHSFDSSELQGRSDVSEWVKRAYDVVSRAASDADAIDTELFDEIRAQLDRADRAYGPLLAEARRELSEREVAHEEAEAQLTEQHEQELERWKERTRAAGDERARVAEQLAAAASTERQRKQLETQLKAELEQAAAERDSLRLAATEIEQDRDRWQERAGVAEEEGAQLAERLESALAAKATTEAELSRETANAARLQAELGQAGAERDQLKAARYQLTAERDRLTAEREQLEARLHAEVDALTRERERLEAQLAARLQAPGDLRRAWLAFCQFASWLIRVRLGYVRRYFALRRSFDGDAYLAANPDVTAAGAHPLLHYIEHGAREGRGLELPSRGMSAWARRRQVFAGLARWLVRGKVRNVRRYFRLRREFPYDSYLAANEDVAAAGLHPLLHYLEHGAHEGRPVEPPPPDEDAAAPEPEDVYVHPDVAEAFDAAFYRERYPDVTGTDADLLQHYLTVGWTEHRDPSARFSTAYYLAHNDDIREAGLNPFVHYVLHGRNEGRLPSNYMATKLGKGYEPTVSAIVPAFNHAPFLRQRIESIVAQDRPPTEIIILDDASTDGTREVIEELRREIDIPLVVELNTENSGNVFKQWRKGLELARGDLVWICESDDFCEEDFLGRLIPYFADPSVTLAFGRIQFADENGTLDPYLDTYRELAAAGYWGEPRVEGAYTWFRGPFGRLNVIPNVGGCLFRRQALSAEVWEEAERYSVCGDWYLYMHLAGGGRIAFDPAAVAYFRQHGANTSVTSFTTPGYYRELASIAAQLRRRYGVDDALLRDLYDRALEQYRPNFPDEPAADFDQIFDLAALTSQEQETRHVLMGIFNLQTGGAEIFPINLANALVERGYVVSMLVRDGENVEPGVRARLRPEIPVYERALVEEIGVERFLRDHGVDLVHTHNFWVDLFVHEACRDAGIPLVATLHGSYETANRGDETVEAIADSVSHWVYTADKNLQAFERLATDPAQFTKMANAVPDPEPGLRLSRREFGIPEEAFVFGIASRAIRTKGWDIAAHALQQVATTAGRPVYLAICGDGDAYDELLAELGDLPGVRFLGHQTNVIAFYRMCDCCLLPTRFPGESFPFTLLESLTAGTPIIASDIGEIRRIVEPDGVAAGIVVPFLGDDDEFTAAFAAAMSRMLGSRETFAQGAEFRAQDYSFERLTESYEELYASVLEESGHDWRGPHVLTAADEVRRRVQPGPQFEEFDPGIAAGAALRAKAIAFYLTQFHSFAENDEWWGKGFTEWTNVARGYPRFAGHYQPRVPRDLGFYNLEQEGVLERQIELARAAGIHGFSYYYYWFDGKRLLEKPLERFLADHSIDFPFCLMWANENWTRRWDGYDQELLMEQTYDPARDADLIDDLQRHFADERYIRIDGRPLLLIYRLDIIPNLRETVDRWRRLWKDRHGEDPLILGAQTFGNDADPRPLGLDGAFEFPPHLIDQYTQRVNDKLALFDPSFTAQAMSYASAVKGSLARPHPDFPLVKTIVPSWDNDARRQGQGLVMHGSTPKLYERWMRGAADIAAAHPIGDEPLVFVNAWNEWAEGAYLEPDVHFGSAYLNATARALALPGPAVEQPSAEEPAPEPEPAIVESPEEPAAVEPAETDNEPSAAVTASASLERPTTQTLTIHIGASKTGSSAIQAFLARNRDWLRERGIVVPDNAMADEPEVEGHHLWYFAQATEKPAQSAAELAEKIEALFAKDGVRQVVLSAENLSDRKDEELRCFADVVRRYETEVVVYLRRQDDWLLSAWQQWRAKTEPDLQAWLEASVGVWGNWRALLERWERVVGRERIHVRLYDRAKLVNGDVVADFEQFLQLDEAVPDNPPEKSPNPSFNEAIVSLIPGSGLFEYENDNAFYAFLESTLGDVAYKRSNESALTYEQRLEILERYEESNGWIRERYFAGEDVPETLFELPRPDQYRVPSESELIREQIQMLYRLAFELHKQRTGAGGTVAQPPRPVDTSPE